MDSTLLDAWFQEITIAALVAILAVLIYIAVMGSRKAGELSGWAHVIAREPVRVRAAIGAVVGILASFGLDVSEEQQLAIVTGIVVIATAVSELARRKVTPIAAPNLSDAP